MSADNYEVCPRCLHAAERAREAEIERIDGLYGQVPLEEWTRLRDAAPEEIDRFGDKYRTFREDYEVYHPEGGRVVFEYTGACHVCGLNTKMRDEKTFWTAVPA